MRELLEREEDLAELDRALARARGAVGQVIVVEGPGGIGKTSLLTAARAEGRDQGMLVLHARGSELERAFPFGVVRQLFERAAGDERHFTGAAGLAKPIFDLAEEAEESSYARLHGLYWLCANLAAEQPLVVCVDDAQWADEPSLNFLGFLLRRLEDLPIALLVGTRPRAEQESDEPARDRHRPRHASAPPHRAERRRRARLGPRRRRRRRRRRLLPRLPRDHRRQPVPRLRAPARGHAQAAEGHRAGGRRGARARPRGDLHGRAAAPEAAPVRRARAGPGDRDPRRGRPAAHRPRSSPGWTRPTAETALDALCRADIITRDGDRVGFVHPIVLSAIYNDLPVHVRAEAHHRAARLLAEHGAAPEEVASHLVVHGAARATRGRSRPSGRPPQRALVLGDPATAVACLQRALEEPPPEPSRAAVLNELARAEAQSGRPAAVEHFRAAMALAATADERGQIAVGLARALKFRGDSPSALGRAPPRARRARPRSAGRGARARTGVLGVHQPRRAAAARGGDRRHPGARGRHHRGSTVCT